MSKKEEESMYPFFSNLMSQCEFDTARPDLPCTYCSKKGLEETCIKLEAPSQRTILNSNPSITDFSPKAETLPPLPIPPLSDDTEYEFDYEEYEERITPRPLGEVPQDFGSHSTSADILPNEDPRCTTTTDSIYEPGVGNAPRLQVRNSPLVSPMFHPMPITLVGNYPEIGIARDWTPRDRPLSDLIYIPTTANVSDWSVEESDPNFHVPNVARVGGLGLHRGSYSKITILPTEFSIKDLEGMVSKNPKDTFTERRLVFSYFKELNPLEAVVKLFSLASQYPSNSRLQEYIELAMSPDPFFLFEKLEIPPISEWPIRSLEDDKSFHAALGGDRKYDFGIDMWWKLLARNPFRMGLLRRFRNAVYDKHPSQEKKGLLSFMHFILRCLLLGLSKRAVDYGI